MMRMLSFGNMFATLRGVQRSLSVRRVPGMAADPPKKQKRMPAIIRPMVPSADLQEFVGDRAIPRSDVIKSLNSYVKEHSLQDPRNKRMVICDEKLGKLLGVKSCTILEISKYITPHLQRPELVGGKYVEEAAKAEEQYLIEKSKMEPKAKRERGKSKQQVDIKTSPLFRPVTLSDELSLICRGRKEMPRQEIVKAVWEYIRLNNLNSTPGKPVRCDFLMKQVFKADTVTVTSIVKGISENVAKKE